MRPWKMLVWIGGLTVLLGGALEGAARTWGPQLLPPDNSKDVAPGESLPGEPNMIEIGRAHV